MEELISFLLKHFYFVIIVVGLIYSMFFRKSPLEKPPANRPAPRPNNRMPDFGGSPAFPPKPRRAGAPEGAPPVERKGPPPVERRDPRPEFREPARPVYRLPESPEPVQAEPAYVRTEPEAVPVRVAAADRPATVPAPAVTETEEARDSLARDDLTRAIVWAEILGPPRARRPFRR